MHTFSRALAVGLVLPTATLAATLNVNSTSGTYAAGDGLCTVIEAVDNANEDMDTTLGDCAAGNGADLIHVPAGTHVPPDSLYIDGDLTLRGAGAAITALAPPDDTTGAVVEVLGGNVVVERLRVTGPNGGLSNQGNLIVSDAIISDNFGAGIVNLGGDLLVRRSAIIDNLGTGLVNGLSGDARVEGSTISGNTVSSCVSPAIVSRTLCFGCILLWPIQVSNSTIADNHAPASCGASLGAVLWDYSSSIRGTLLDNPDLSDCGFSTDSLGHNLDSDGSCGFTDPTDLSNVDPLLGPLQFNGGPTPTHALQLGSPAIDAIPSADCTWDHDGDPGTPEVALTKDQRGGMRPREGNGSAPSGCDIGAYEVAACADGLDNDGDGRIDFDGGATAGITPLASLDSDCASALGNSEAPPPPVGCGLGPELAPALLLLLIARRRSCIAARLPPSRARPR